MTLRDSATRVALITGASSGIGWATAEQLSRDGYFTVLVARRRDRLQVLADQIGAAGGEALVVAADLALEADRERVLDETRAAGCVIDVLINNAGFGWYGYAGDLPWAVARQMLAVNVEAVTHLTLLVLPAMRARDDGHIINVGSVAGNLGAQGVALYGGTKALVSSFSRALSRELRGTGVHTSLVQAGIVTGTEFYTAMTTRPGSLRIPAGSFGVTPAKVANRISAVCRRPRKATYVPGILRATTWVEPLFGWALDAAGSLHLRRAAAGSRHSATPNSK